MWAHSVNVCGRRRRLSAHLRATADLAREFAAPFGAGDLAAALGLLHDAGKASTAWQRRLLMVEAARGKGGCAAQGTRRAIGLVDGRSGRDGDPGSITAGLGDRAEFLDVVGRAVEFETRDRLVVEIPETSALIDAAEPAHSPRPSQSTRTATHRPLTEHMTAPAHLRDQRRLMAP